MATQVVTELQQAPLAELVEKLGVAISNAQLALDRNSASIAQLLADEQNGIDLGDGGRTRSLLELGFAPTFYHITEATIDARVAFTSSQSEQFTIGASVGVNVGFFAASVNASYTNKYQFDAEGSSAIHARFVSIPPPSVFNELLQSLMRSRNQ
jgi:hypothetical protein